MEELGARLSFSKGVVKPGNVSTKKFHPDGQPELVGILTRYNKKTVTVVTDPRQHWNVSPSLLTKAESAPAPKAATDDSGVARFPNRSAEK